MLWTMCYSFVNISYFGLKFLQYTLDILYFRKIWKTNRFFEARTRDYILKRVESYSIEVIFSRRLNDFHITWVMRQHLCLGCFDEGSARLNMDQFLQRFTLYSTKMVKNKRMAHFPVQEISPFQIEFEPVSLQTQTAFNVQRKVLFKIPRIRNRSNSQKNDQILTKKHYPNQTIIRKTNKKEERAFGSLTSFFFPLFLLVFLMIVWFG